MNIDDCWIVAYSDGQRCIVPIKNNVHETLFIANAKTGGGSGRMTKITSVFQNKYIGQIHRRSVDTHR